MSEEKVVKKAEEPILGMMFSSFIITYATGAFCFENAQTEQFIGIYRYVALITCLLTWFGFSLACGIKKKWQYEVFAFCFWLLPLLIIYLANDGPEVFRLSLAMYLLSEFANVLTVSPALLIGNVINTGEFVSILIILILCVLCYIGGIFISRKLNRGEH